MHIRYLNHHLTRQMNELYVSTVIFAFGEATLDIFAPIYLFKLGFGLEKILLYFMAHYLAYAIFMLFSGKMIAKIGYETSIGLSMPLYGLYLSALFFMPGRLYLFYISALAWALFKSVYWPAFHADFTKNGNTDARGEEIGWLKLLIGLVSVLGPAIGGFILSRTGFSFVFIIAIALCIVSLIPLFISREKYEPEEFSPRSALAKFLKPKYRNDIIANLGTGEDTIAQTVWPIFLLTALVSYQNVGLLTTLALCIAFVMILVTGKIANLPKRARLIKTTSAILSLSWFARIFSFNWLAIFISDAIYKTSKRTLDVPIQALVYSRPKENRFLNYLIFREIALCLGKILSAGLALAVFIITGEMFWTFALAAVLTLFYFYWTDQIAQENQQP